MNTRTLEDAVRSMGIELEQIKLSHGQVLVASGRERNGRRVLWDGHGRAYLCDDSVNDSLDLLLHPATRYDRYDIQLAG